MRDEELDQIIDAGLNTYAEPRFGLEQRILAAVAAKNNARELTARSPRWRMWAAGLAAAVCLLAAITVAVRVVEAPHSRNEQAVNRTHAPVMDRAANPEPRADVPVQVAAKHRGRRIQEARLRRLPKKELFPTPQPLSPELQALAQFVARAPEPQRRQLIDAQAKLDAPITIAPLQIAPLKESYEDEH